MQPSERTNAYLRKVCAHVRWKQSHAVICRDLRDHIEDQSEAYVRGGMDKDRAAARAVLDMGDPADVGLLLDASYRPRTEWAVAIPFLILLMLSAVLQPALYGVVSHYEAYAGESLLKLGLSAALGGLLALLLYNGNLYRLYKLSFAGYALVCISLLRRSTLDVAGLGYQGDAIWPYVSLLAPVFLAGVLYALRGRGLGRVILANALCAAPFLYALLWSGNSFPVLLPCLLPSLAVLLLFLASGQVGGKRWHVALITLLTWCAVLLLLTWNWQRMTLNPFRYRQLAAAVMRTMGSDFDYAGAGVRDILEHAKPFGRGGLTPRATELFFANTLWGEPVSGLEWGFLTDYFITYLIYRFGWVVGLAVTAPLPLAIGFGYSRCRRLCSMLGKMLCTAILGVLTVQTLLYLLGCFGFTRLGVYFPLPFLSVGYRALVVNMALMGMLLGLFRTDGLYVDKTIDKMQ